MMKRIHVGSLVIVPLTRTGRGRTLGLGLVFSIRRDGAAALVDVEALLPPTIYDRITPVTHSEKEIMLESQETV